MVSPVCWKPLKTFAPSWWMSQRLTLSLDVARSAISFSSCPVLNVYLWNPQRKVEVSSALVPYRSR